MSEDHVVLITGAAGGIGRATINLFTEKGWRVIGVDCNEFGDDIVDIDIEMTALQLLLFNSDFVLINCVWTESSHSSTLPADSWSTRKV